LALLFLLISAGAAHASEPAFVLAPDVIRPGKYYDVLVDAPYDGNAFLTLLTEDEYFVTIILSDYPLQAGENRLTWDGMRQDDAVPAPGEYILRFAMDDGAYTDRPLRIGDPYPILSQFSQSDTILSDAPLSITFSSSEDGSLGVSLLSLADGTACELEEAVAHTGVNAHEWDGAVQNGRVPDGAYALIFTLRTENGFESIPHYVNIEVLSPGGSEVDKDTSGIVPGEGFKLNIPAEASPEEPTDSLSKLLDVLASMPTEPPVVSSGAQGTTGPLDDPDPEEATDLYEFSDEFSDSEEPANPQGIQVSATVEIVDTDLDEPTRDPLAIPSYGMSVSPPYSSVSDGGFWSMTPGELDDGAIWEILTQPIVVYDGGIPQGVKSHAYLMENPDGTGKKVAQLHTQSQGVHVIGEPNQFGYVLVEAFSNYDRDYFPKTDEEKAQAFDLKYGYVRADHLKTVDVMTDMALLIDKLTQRMYIFIDGVRVTELLISTGTWTNSKDMMFETVPGEFITVSHVGAFPFGNMVCDMAIRINGGVLLHEVPHKVNADKSRNYSSFEGWLGTKQSHGCVRIQRLKNEDGYNCAWLWNNIKKNKPYKVIIWDDLNRYDSPSTWYPNPKN